MINNKDFKYIIKRVLIGLTIAFILFNINKCNAYALVWKGTEVTGFQSGSSFTGTLNGNQNLVLESVFTDNISTEGYDYLVFPLYEINFSTEENFNFDNPSLSVPRGYSFYCYSGSDYCSQASILESSQSIPQDLYGTFESGAISFSAQIWSSPFGNNNGVATLCYFNSNENQIYCPVSTMPNVKKLALYINTRNVYGSYKITYYRLKNKYNNDSTEIVNGLGGVQQQQQQTNDTLTDSNITAANTDTNNALNGIENNVSTTLDNSISANSLNTLLTGFVNQLSNTTCTPITLPIPFTNENLVLPCLGTEFSQRIPVLWDLYELIITGVLVLRFWQHAMEFILNILDPYHIGANNVPTGGGK